LSIQLYEHNRNAYEAMLGMIEKTGKAAIIHPTGTGKSFIGLKLCADNPDKCVCWLSPSEYIFHTQLENWQDAGGKLLENIRFFTYAKLMLMEKDELEEIHADFIVLDEFHRCGAEMWGQGVARLLNLYPDAPRIGLSATNIRYLDNQRDMADELFDGYIASEITLGDAIVQGILNPPKYVLSIYSYMKDLERYEKRVRSAKSQMVQDEGMKYLEALRRALEKADGLDEIFHKHVEDKNGKYIVFCSNVEHLFEMTEIVPKWFHKVDKECHIYTAYSDNPETSKEFIKFKEDNSEHIKLLFCIDMLNEGIHVKDISGVILLRPTVSPIIYKQQIGRAFSANKNKNIVIFDIVLNIENLYSIGAIEEEMQIATAYYRLNGKSDRIVNEHFHVIDEVRDCIELFDKLTSTLSASWDMMYEVAKKYYEEHGNLAVTTRYVTDEGHTLGLWLNTQKKVYAGKVKGILTDSQVEKLNAIGMRWKSDDDISWEANFSEAVAYYEKNGNLMVSLYDEDNKKLAAWISRLRHYRNKKLKTGYLTEERIAALDAIGMIWDVHEYQWEQNYNAAKQYYKENGHLNVPHKYTTPDGISLGTWVSRIRTLRNNPDSLHGDLTEDRIAELDEIGMIWGSKYELNWNNYYNAVCRYRQEHGNLNMPRNYMSEEGYRLYNWLLYQRAHKDSLNQDFIDKLNAIGMVWSPEMDEWNEKYEHALNYYKKHGNLNMKSDYAVEGVKLKAWLKRQAERLNGKASGRSKSVRELTSEQIEKLGAIGIVRMDSE